MASTNRRRPRFDPRLFAWGLNDQQPAPRRTVGVNNVHLFSRGLSAWVYLMSALPPKGATRTPYASIQLHTFSAKLLMLRNVSPYDVVGEHPLPHTSLGQFTRQV